MQNSNPALRPGRLMVRHEPLAQHLLQWRPGCPSVAVYGLRRCCTMVR